MRHNLLRLALALLAICAIVPASAEARSGGGTAKQTDTASMPVDWSAGPVHRWTGYHRAGGSRRVRELQRRLNRLGYRAGPVDGLFGPRTERATRRFQRRHGLRVDAIAGPRTVSALRRRDAARREAPTTAPTQTRPEVHAPLPDRIPVTAAPRPADAPADPAPDLPVVPVLVAFALIGVAAFARGFLRTTARIQRMQREGRHGAPRGPAIHGEPGR